MINPDHLSRAPLAYSCHLWAGARLVMVPRFRQPIGAIGSEFQACSVLAKIP
jgi:hypothetical protein